MSRYIKNLILQGEHQTQDFKFVISDSQKIARSLSAFANTHGGRLLIGVKDNGNIAGVKSDEEYYMVEAAANFYCKPEIQITPKVWKVDGKTVLEIIIPESKKKPILAKKEKKWLAFIRVKDENILANSVWIEFWKMNKQKKGVLIQYSETEQILLDYLNNYPFISISKYCKIAQITNKMAVKTIARLINFEIINIDFYENKFVYKLK